MTRAEFSKLFFNIVEIDPVEESTDLSALEDWDSLAAVNTLALFKQKLKHSVTADQIIKCATIGDIFDLGNAHYAA